MKKILIVVGALALLAIAAVVVTAIVAKDKFKPHAERVLADLEAGKEAEVYAGASAAFRKEISRETFHAYVAVRTRALGKFRRVAKATGGGISTSTDAGTVGSVSLDLEYERGPAEGTFQFVKEGDDWKLLGLKITFDEKLVPAPDRAALEGRCRELLALFDASSFTALYAKFSRPLQDAWKAQTYEPQIRDLFAKTGPTTSATLRETKDEGDGRVRLTFDVEFAHGPGEATFGWAPAEGEWHLTAFDLHTGRR